MSRGPLQLQMLKPSSPQISQAICYDSGSYGTSRTCLVRRLSRVPTHRHPPDFGKPLIRRPGKPGLSRDEVCEICGLGVAKASMRGGWESRSRRNPSPGAPGLRRFIDFVAESGRISKYSRGSPDRCGERLPRLVAMLIRCGANFFSGSSATIDDQEWKAEESEKKHGWFRNLSSEKEVIRITDLAEHLGRSRVRF